MVGTGANRMPLTKIHPILLGKQKSEGGGLLARHRQQFEERRQDVKSPMQMRGPRPPQMQPPPPRMQPPPPQRQPPPPSHQQSGFGGGMGQRPPSVTYPPRPGMYQGRPPLPYSMSQQQQPPPPGFVPSSQPPPPVGRETFKREKSPSKSHSSESRELVVLKSEPKDASTPEVGAAPAKKKRKSRWGAVEDKASVVGPMTTLPANLTEEQRKQYLIQFKIEEITQKLRTGELGIPVDPGERSPSPEPIYNSEGKRLNTREFRVRKQLEEERHNLIKQAIEEIPNYKPPIDYKPPASKICDKVFIPAERNPAVNFIGLLIGPRGNTLKRLEKETGCKIIIRGKGSVKEGKVGRIPGQLMPGEDEPLHALITGPTEEEVKKGKQVVADIVKEGIECPDAANELRRNQLRELAELNGTLIDDEVIKCKNCGLADHRHWECTERKNVTSEISCTKCGGYGHVAADCKVKVEANAGPAQTFAEKAKMDTEYLSLMAELGVDAPPPPSKTESQSASASGSGSSGGVVGTLLPAPSSSSSPVVIMPPPSSNSNRMPPPSSNSNRMPPPNNNNNNNAPPRGPPLRGGGPRGGGNKWGPPRPSGPPLSLMDVNLDPCVQNKFHGPRSGGMGGPRGPRPHGPRSDGSQDMPPWRNRGPAPMQNNSQFHRGNNPIPPWQQRGPSRGPPPNSNFGPPPSNSGYGPPPNSGYGPPPNSGYGPPPNSGYGPPPSNSGYGPPPSNSSYGPPSQNSGMAPPQNTGMPPPQNSGIAPAPNTGSASPQNTGMAPPQNAGMAPPQSSGMPPPQSTGAAMPNQSVSYPSNHWSQPNAFASLPPNWATQPPPPPPPE